MEEPKNSGELDLEHAANASHAEEAAARMLAERLRRRVADRLKRINDHRADTQDSPTARTAALRGICADLMEIEANVAESFREAVEAMPLTSENVAEYSESIDLVIRLAKQITQMSQLEMRSSRHEG